MFHRHRYARSASQTHRGGDDQLPDDEKTSHEHPL
jgi:hypothetical protein